MIGVAVVSDIYQGATWKLPQLLDDSIQQLGITAAKAAEAEVDQRIVVVAVEGDRLRISTGYPHSALAFYYLMLFTIWLVLGWWQNRKYNSGWRRLFPGEKV